MWKYCSICVQFHGDRYLWHERIFSLKANHNTVISNHNSIVSFPFSGMQYRGNGPVHYCQYQTVGHRRLYRLQFPLTEGTIGLYMTINIRIGISMVLCTRFEHQGFGGGGGRDRWANGVRGETIMGYRWRPETLKQTWIMSRIKILFTIMKSGLIPSVEENIK